MDDLYSPYTALLYIFNLIVGTGALTLPKAFSEAGWLFSSVVIVFISFISYVTATFVIEAVAICNALNQWEKLEKMKRVSRYLRLTVDTVETSDDDDISDTEDSLMLPAAYIENFPSEPKRLFTLDIKCELSEMATTLFNKGGQLFFYICVCLYLYGDLTIYSAAIGKTLVDLTCTTMPNVTENDHCWVTYDFSRRSIYQLYLGCFLMLFGPFVFFNIQKTKYLQFITSVTRWLAFTLMIGLAIARIADSSKAHGHPELAVASGLPALLGSCVYSFMCHHSLPGLLAPVSDKSKIFTHLALDYSAILIFYLTLALTALFAFPSLDDLYSLDFIPTGSAWSVAAGIFLTSFPIMTLTTSFPIISVTLRSNLQAIFSSCDWWFLRALFVPLLTVIPPVFIAMTTENIETLVGITGSYAGVVIQYVIPASLILVGRKSIPEAISNAPFPYKSPFQSPLWPFLIIIWAFISVVLVTFDLIREKSVRSLIY
uniref:Amino acid transporter transmembrane domain-containing protein n=1 Tax=Riptortus pedestris TaxID=329032 RepID=R4WE06_RIPPE|nr:conserved hypothetical protein [Riptortus pedestris]